MTGLSIFAIFGPGITGVTLLKPGYPTDGALFRAPACRVYVRAPVSPVSADSALLVTMISAFVRAEG
jgi:hypothetical protein